MIPLDRSEYCLEVIMHVGEEDEVLCGEHILKSTHKGPNGTIVVQTCGEDKIYPLLDLMEESSKAKHMWFGVEKR